MAPRERDRIRWAPRVRPALIRRLYERDAHGIVDAELIDQVGHALLGRCETIRRVTEYCCPHCGGSLEGVRESPRHRGRPIRCPACGWRSTWAVYHRSYKRTRAHGGRAYPCFRAFLAEFPACRTPREKMLAIDRLMHAVHEFASKTFTTPAAVNLIEGTREEVIAFLDGLAWGDPDDVIRRDLRAAYRRKMEETFEPTRRHLEEVQRRRRG